ncbi:MAG: hypothetical protein ACXVFQ_18370 [Solirubrobacteraceae bacterium]
MSAPYSTLHVRRRAIAAAGAAFLGLMISACGGGSRVARTVHFNGQANGSYVSETSAAGTTFLLPAADVARQGSQTFQVVNAANGNAPNSALIGPGSIGSLYTAIVASATTVVPHDAHVELLATGTPGLRFLLQWTDTCGRHGGDGWLVLHSPAVVNLKLPRSTGNKTCYLATTAETHTFTALHLDILDH